MAEEQRKKQPGEGVFGILMLLLGLGFLWRSYEIAGFSSLSSPGAFPMAASAAMVVAALVVVIRDVRRPTETEGPVGRRARAFASQVTPSIVVIFAGFVVGYAALLNTLGFMPSSFLFLLAGIHFLYRGSFLFSVAVSLGSLVIIYAVFRLVFQVVLPEGIVPEREIMAWVEGLFAGAEPAREAGQ